MEEKTLSYQLFDQIRKSTSGHDRILSNVQALGLPEGTRALHILWMYPDVLNVFGGRGDLMALMRVSCAMGLPAEMRRLDSLSDEIPLDWADLIYYASGDLTCMENILKGHKNRAGDFRAYAESGRMIVAVSSSGAVLAEKVKMLDGSSFSGLGLLGMTMTERKKVHGDDLWIRTADGTEIAGNQIQLTDVTLAEGQEAFADVIYGRGNDGNGKEGAVTGNVIYTGCVGPVLVRNPWLAAGLLRRAAETAGIRTASGSFVLPEEEIVQERLSAEEAKEFIRSKMEH